MIYHLLMRLWRWAATSLWEVVAEVLAFQALFVFGAQRRSGSAQSLYIVVIPTGETEESQLGSMPDADVGLTTNTEIGSPASSAQDPPRHHTLTDARLTTPLRQHPSIPDGLPQPDPTFRTSLKHFAVTGDTLEQPQAVAMAQAASALRYRCLLAWKWVKPNSAQLDQDRYDPLATTHHLYIHRSGGQQLVGYVRLLEGQRLTDFMIGHEFRGFLSSEDFIKLCDFVAEAQGHCVEASRFVVDEDRLTEHERTNVADRVFEAIGEWCAEHSKTHILMVTRKEVTSALRCRGYWFFELVCSSTEWRWCLLDVRRSRS